jgi:hypothetical protein
MHLVSAIAGLLAWFLTPTSAQSVDQSFYYKLSTQFRGNGMKLDVFNGGPKNNLTRLEPDQDVSGSSGDSWGTAAVPFAYQLCSAAPTCELDIFSGGANNNQPGSWSAGRIKPSISVASKRVEHQQPARKLVLHSNHQHLVSPECANGYPRIAQHNSNQSVSSWHCHRNLEAVSWH